MGLQKTITIDPVDVDTDGLAKAQAVAGAGALTLNGDLISSGKFSPTAHAYQISITSDGADGGRTFTVTGKDPDGKTQTEDITGPATTTVESSKYWSEVSQIAADAACAGNISSGTVDELVTKTIVLDKYNDTAATLSIEDITGTLNVSVEETFSDIQNSTTFEFYAVTALATKTAATRASISVHATGARLKFNSYTNGADCKLVIVQGRD